MSEPAAKRPMDFDDFERRLRAPEPAPQAAGHDPLTELARLVDGSRDPYADVFGRSGAPQRANLPGLKAVTPEPPQATPYQPESYPQEAPAAPQGEGPGGADWQIRREEWPPSFPQARAAAPAIEPPPAAEAPYATPEADYDDLPAPKKSRKAFYLMAASLTAVTAGIGATVLTRGGGHAPQDAPIIKAAQGPMKVQPEQPAASSEPSRTASVLDKSADKLGPTKVISRDEQPIDIASARVVKQAPPAPAPAATSNLFPEPRRVRTIPVRPDGTLASDLEAAKPTTTVAAIPAPTPAPAARPTTTASITPLQLPKPTPAAPATPAVAPAAQPKATTRVAPSDAPRPQAQAARPMALAGASDPSPVATTPKAASGGGFSVQLAAAASDSEAREKAGRFAGQFSGALGGRRPAVVQGEAHGKSVYRVRVTGLSKDDAASMCGKIKQGGGACFVAAN